MSSNDINIALNELKPSVKKIFEKSEYDFDNAQVTSGGISLSEIDDKTRILISKLQALSNIYTLQFCH